MSPSARILTTISLTLYTSVKYFVFVDLKPGFTLQRRILERPIFKGKSNSKIAFFIFLEIKTVHGIREPTSDLNLDISVFCEVMQNTENWEKETLRAEKLINNCLTSRNHWSGVRALIGPGGTISGITHYESPLTN